MAEPTITCPSCSKEIKLTESLAAPLIQEMREKFQSQIEEKENAIEKKEKAIRKREEKISDAEKSIEKTIEDQVSEKLETERNTIREQEKKKAESDIKVKIEDLEASLTENDKKLKKAQDAEVDFLRKKRELENAKREIDLNVENQVKEKVSAIHEKAKAEAEDELKLKIDERDKTINSMKAQIEDLKSKAEQGSQQTQGEVMELSVEDTLRNKFPHDIIEPIPKGESGADIRQRIDSPTSIPCGSILWETKRTKRWSKEWTKKLRNDQRNAESDLAVIVSEALPKEVKAFDYVDGVWVTAPQYYVPLALALRQSLIEINKTKIANMGQQTKMEQVYEYLTGPRFRHRIEAIVEKLSDMQKDLDQERKTMTRLWAKRQTQIEGVTESSAGMYGDLQGIAGQEIREIEGLELTALEGATNETPVSSEDA